MRGLAGATLLLLASVGSGCQDDCGDVACGDPETLYVELPSSIPPSAVVQLSFEGACATAEMTSPADGGVPWSEVGAWSDNKTGPVEVSVRIGDTELSRGSAVADLPEDCCGDICTVRPA